MIPTLGQKTACQYLEVERRYMALQVWLRGIVIFAPESSARRMVPFPLKNSKVQPGSLCLWDMAGEVRGGPGMKTAGACLAPGPSHRLEGFSSFRGKFK